MLQGQYLSKIVLNTIQGQKLCAQHTILKKFQSVKEVSEYMTIKNFEWCNTRNEYRIPAMN